MSKMSGRSAERMALGFCMQGVARYLDCLNGVVNVFEKDLPPEFVAEVRKDFASYAEKMTAAGMPFKTITVFETPDAQG